jgi:hypothetical protein
LIGIADAPLHDPAFTFLLPEVKGRDPDLVFAEEMREKKARSGRV